MMNGSIILCEKVIENPQTGLISLYNIRNRLHRGSELFAIYCEFSPERLGRHEIEIELVHRESQKKSLLIYLPKDPGEVTIIPTHMKRRMFRITDAQVPLHITDRGTYALDLIVDGIIYATASLECT